MISPAASTPSCWFAVQMDTSHTTFCYTQRSSVLPLILAFSAGFVVLVGSICLVLARPAIFSENPATGKWAFLLVIFALTIGMSILSWYFSSMTVEVTDDELRWRFSGGQGYRIVRAEIDSVRIVPHHWWMSYGIKYCGPKRWTYVIGGRETVEVGLKSGGWRRLGTGNPHGLLAVLTSSAR
jgi:hypothetical protein